MFKVYYNNKIILFSEKEAVGKSFTKINFLDEDKIKSELNIFLNKIESNNINIFGKDFVQIPEFVKSQFVFIRAAGGVVRDEIDRILYINRLGYYDFPKGKAELGETEEITALREVCEECGILEHDLKIIRKIQNIYHIYPYKSGFALKETAWFSMIFSGNYNLKPQIEENILSVGWLSSDELGIFREKTYPSLLDLVQNLV